MKSLLNGLSALRTRIGNSSSGVVSVGLVLSLVLGAGAFVLGRSVSTLAVRSLTGSAWLATSDRGVTLVDGTTGQPTADLQLDGANDLVVTQDSSGVLVLDPTTGLLTRIDSSALTAEASREIASARGAHLLSRAGSTYLVDQSAGVVQSFDVTALTLVGAPVDLGGAIARAVIDADGTLWAWVPSADAVTPVARTETGTKVTVPESAVALTLLGERPAIVVNGAGPAASISVISRVGLEEPLALREAESTVPAGDLLVPAEARDGRLPVIDVAGSQALVIDLETEKIERTDLSPEILTSTIDDPELLGDIVYIPDFGRGTVYTVNTVTDALGQVIQVRDGAGPFDIVPKDGLLFFNDPSSNEAVVVNAQGEVQEVEKYVEEIADEPEATTAPPTLAPPTQPIQPDQPTSPPAAEPGPPMPPTTSRPPTTAPTRPPPTTTRPPSTTTSPPPTTTTSSPPTSNPPPNKPRRVEAEPQDDWVLVSWQPPDGGGPVKRYDIRVEPESLTLEERPSLLRALYSGTTCGSTYTFFVRAVGFDGEKSDEARSDGYTTVACPPGQVQGLTVGNVTDSTVELHWADQADALSYDIEIVGVRWDSVSDPPYVVSGLESYRTYTFRVQARNDGGPGPYAETSATTRIATVDLFECADDQTMPGGGKKAFYGAGGCIGGTSHTGRFITVASQPYSGFLPLFRFSRDRDNINGCTYIKDYILATSGDGLSGFVADPVPLGYVPASGDVPGATPVHRFWWDFTSHEQNCHSQIPWAWKSWSQGPPGGWPDWQPPPWRQQEIFAFWGLQRGGALDRARTGLGDRVVPLATLGGSAYRTMRDAPWAVLTPRSTVRRSRRLGLS